MFCKQYLNILLLISTIISVPVHGISNLSKLWRSYGPSASVRPSQVREVLLQEDLNKLNLLAYLEELAQQRAANLTERNPFFIAESPTTIREMIRPYAETSQWGQDLTALMDDINFQRATQEQQAQRFAQLQRQLLYDKLLKRLAAQSGYSQQFDMF